MQKSPPTITTAELSGLLVRAERLWLIRVPEDSESGLGQIPGSLATSDVDLLAALSADTPMVLYGSDEHADRARTLATTFAATGRDARWYPGGLRAWVAAAHPTDPA